MTDTELDDQAAEETYGPAYTGLRYETALDAAQRVLDRFPAGFVYSTGYEECYYVPSTDPRFPRYEGLDNSLPPAAESCGCLVGETLTELGLMTDTIAGSRAAIGSLADTGELDAEPDAVRFLGLLQSWQDGGAPWNDAIGLAAGEIFLTRQQRATDHTDTTDTTGEKQ